MIPLIRTLTDLQEGNYHASHRTGMIPLIRTLTDLHEGNYPASNHTGILRGANDCNWLPLDKARNEIARDRWKQTKV